MPVREPFGRGGEVLDHAAQEALRGLKDAGIDFVSGLPDGWQRNVHELVDQPRFFVRARLQRGRGVLGLRGAWLGGKKPALIMENSGLRVASEYIARISLGTGVPMTLLLSYRGRRRRDRALGHPPRDRGRAAAPALRVPYLVVREPDRLRRAIMRAHRTRRPSSTRRRS
jgi:sulfopyruvate decarboxylase subunit alpha